MFSMRPCGETDVPTVREILKEAAEWLEQTGQPLWSSAEITEANIAKDIGFYCLAFVDTVPAGILKLQMEDSLFWPDFPEANAAYMHRVALRRSFAGRGISQAMLGWALDRARSMDKKYLRLDCEASRPRLRAVYGKFGFIHHSDRQVGSYFVARYEYQIQP